MPLFEKNRGQDTGNEKNSIKCHTLDDVATAAVEWRFHTPAWFFYFG
jgi:hypothetical protein